MPTGQCLTGMNICLRRAKDGKKEGSSESVIKRRKGEKYNVKTRTSAGGANYERRQNRQTDDKINANIHVTGLEAEKESTEENPLVPKEDVKPLRDSEDEE